MRIILSCSVYSLIVYIPCIMQHVNNILIVCFQKKNTKICPSHERPSFGLSCRRSIYMTKAVLEYFLRCVVTARQQQYVPIVRTPRTPSESTVLTTNRSNAMIM
jgi:hypothetical protein